MIVNIPNHNDLADIAAGWLNLAWDIAIKEAQEVQQFGFLLDDAVTQHGEECVRQAMEEYWGNKRLELNNSLSLLQQSIELFLKSRIAEVSPFLLIAGEPRSWPAPTDNTGDLDFSDLKTIDATQLCRAAQLISKQPIPSNFTKFYERLRKARNKIVHLNGGNAKAEVQAILVDILTAHQFLFPNQLWVEFLRRGETAAKGEKDYCAILFGVDAIEDMSNDVICAQVGAALFELDDDEAKSFFGYDSEKSGYNCPTCLSRRSGHSDHQHDLLQVQADNNLKCLVCLSVFSVEEYKKAMIKFYGYLDANEQAQIAAELEGSFP